MTAFIFHLRRLPEAVMGQPRAAQLLGKLAIPGGIVLAQTGVILLMLMFMLNMRVSNLPGFAATMALVSLTFLVIIVALNRAFGDVGKGVALILLILQLSSAGGVFTIELSSSFFQGLNLPVWRAPFGPECLVPTRASGFMLGWYWQSLLW